MPPDSGILIAELRRLSNRELRLTLSELSPQERTRVLALIEDDRTDPQPSFETLAGLSPWLLRAIDEARSPEAAERERQTPATRAALLSALSQVAASDLTERPRTKPADIRFIRRLVARTRSWAAL